jgi:hypothetical protein
VRTDNPGARNGRSGHSATNGGELLAAPTDHLVKSFDPSWQNFDLSLDLHASVSKGT